MIHSNLFLVYKYAEQQIRELEKKNFVFDSITLHLFNKYIKKLDIQNFSSTLLSIYFYFFIYSDEIITILNHGKQLGYQEKPDYKMLHNALNKSLKSMKISQNSPIDWSSANLNAPKTTKKVFLI